MEASLFDRWVETALPSLRQAINLLECVFDAETVVVGGMMPAPLLEKVLARLPPLYQSVRGRYLPAMRVKMGMTGTDTAALGAAALPIFDEFNPQFPGIDEVGRRRNSATPAPCVADEPTQRTAGGAHR